MINNTWQPIETAPKDGTYILAHRKYSTIPVVVAYDQKYGEFEEYAGEHVYGIDLWMKIPQVPEGFEQLLVAI